jgi:hypothetical protein
MTLCYVLQLDRASIIIGIDYILWKEFGGEQIRQAAELKMARSPFFDYVLKITPDDLGDIAK